MGKYKLRSPELTEASQWFTNGDHPNDNVGEPIGMQPSGKVILRTEGAVVQSFRKILDSDLNLRQKTPEDMHVCGHMWGLHGFVHNRGSAGTIVCPGDWIISVETEYPEDLVYGVMSDERFRVLYEEA